MHAYESRHNVSAYPLRAAMELLRTLSEPYYGLHFLTFLSYLVARDAAVASYSPEQRHHFFRREVQTFLSLGVVLCIKCRKSISYEAFYCDGMLYGKCMLVLLACMLDWCLAAWYIIIYAVIFLVVQQPTCKELGNIIEMTPLQLENALSEEKSWLIEFRAVWSSRCIQGSQVFTNLSLRYSTEQIYFGSVDLGRFPKAGEAYGITLGVNMGQLPTYIFFEHGNEVSRLPDSSYEGNLMVESFSESLIAKHFELDRHLIFSLDRNCTKKGG